MGRGMCVAARVLLLSSIPWVDGYSAAGPLLVRRDVVSAALAILNAVPGPGCDVAVIGASGRTGEECVRYCVATGRSVRALSRKGSFLAVSSPLVRSAEPLKSPAPHLIYIYIYILFLYIYICIYPLPEDLQAKGVRPLGSGVHPLGSDFGRNQRQRVRACTSYDMIGEKFGG
jgi:hypothetical protein